MPAPPFLAMIVPVDPPGTSPPGPPLGIWGPGDPRPTLPIAGWNPGTGTWPTPPGWPPLGIWGPTDPRPTLPIAGWNPGTGTWPPPVVTPIPPDGGGDPTKAHLVMYVPNTATGQIERITFTVDLPPPGPPPTEATPKPV